MIDYLESYYGDKIYVAPNIPTKKIINFIDTIGINIKSDDIIVLVDDTVFGSAKTGFIITNEYIVSKEQFEDAKISKLDENYPFKVTKSVLGAKINDNDKVLIDCTQASYDNLLQLFDDINQYIADCLVDDEDAEDEEINNNFQEYYDTNKQISIFNFINDDKLIISINSIFGTPEFSFAVAGLSIAKNILESLSGDNNDKEMFYLIKRYILEITNYLRQLINNNKIKNLQNDFATIELVAFSNGVLKSRLLKLIKDKELTSSIMYSSLTEILKGSINSKLCNYLNYTYDDCSDLDEFIYKFYFRLFLSNQKKNIFYADVLDELFYYSKLFGIKEDEFYSEKGLGNCLSEIIYQSFEFDIYKLETISDNFIKNITKLIIR